MSHLPKITNPVDPLTDKQSQLANKATVLVGAKGGEAEDSTPFGPTFYTTVRRWVKRPKTKVP